MYLGGIIYQNKRPSVKKDRIDKFSLLTVCILKTWKIGSVFY